jgi:phage major head subunit gpT-like protein
MIVDHHSLSLLFTGFKANFKRGEELAKPMYKAVAMEIPSGTSAEEYDWLGAAEGMREWVDDRVIASLGSLQYEIVNKDWEQTIGVDRNKIEDDTHGHYSPMFQRMGEAAELHPDELCFGLFNTGLASLGYDGVPFFSASHPCMRNPVPASHPGVQANLHSNGSGPYWYLLDLSSTLKPIIFQSRKKRQFVAKHSLTDDNVFHQKKFLYGVDARYNAGYGLWQYAFASNRDLTEANVEAAMTAMTGLYADNGKPMNVSPTHILVPTTLQFGAKRIFAPDFVPSGTDGATITNIHRGAAQMLVSKHLARTA